MAALYDNTKDAYHFGVQQSFVERKWKSAVETGSQQLQAQEDEEGDAVGACNEMKAQTTLKQTKKRTISDLHHGIRLQRNSNYFIF